MSARTRRTSFARPHLRRNYVTLAMPGGAAAEVAVGAPSGTSHLLEHLLYRQNDDERVLDRLGGRVGLETRAETMWVSLAFGDEEIGEATQRFLAWWHGLALPPHVVAQEKAVVIDEVSHALRRPERAVWQRLTSALVPGSHLARDFAGQPEQLGAATIEELARVHRDIAGLGCALVGIGPRPFGDDDHTGATFAPPPISIHPQPERVVEFTRGPTHAIVAAGRVLAGRRSPFNLGSHAAAALALYGRVHPSQIAFHTELAYRYMAIELRMYADVAIFAAIARCAPQHAEQVERLLVELVEDPLRGSDEERLSRCVRHHLAALADDAWEASAEEASRLLVGAEPLAAVLDEALTSTPSALRERLQSSFLGPVSSVVLRPFEERK